MWRFASVVFLVVALAACSSGAEDQLATDTCEVLAAFQAGDLTTDEVAVEFGLIVERAAEQGADVAGIEAQVQVQCFDALQDYLDRLALESGA